jgi:hypothetical protein
MKKQKTRDEPIWGKSIFQFMQEKQTEGLYAYFTTDKGNDLCPSCAHGMFEFNVGVGERPIEYHINYENENLVCHECEVKIKSKRVFEKEREEKAKYVGTTKNLRAILTDMGFYSTGGLGIWKFSETLYPGNTIELCYFTKGSFWLEEGGKRIYSGNYKRMLIEDFIAILLKIIDKV